MPSEMDRSLLPAQTTAALFFHPEAYSTGGPKLMGRHAAGESFLRGFLAHGRNSEFWLQVEDQAHARAFVRAAKAAGRTGQVRVVDKHSLGSLAQPGAIFYPGPGIGAYAWQRAGFGHGAWSLCGITHTISSTSAMESLTGLLTAPVQPWDAVICTSTAGQAAVQRMWQAQADYLRQRLGAQRLVLPQLPVIPLGIHADDFEFSQAQRAAGRRALGADAATRVVLFAGRLSFHAKAHPLAMYQALELAAQGLPAGQKVLLVECGKHFNAAIGKAFADAARTACPSVRVLSLDGREGDNYQHAWAGADVFCSLSDNLQETFGITPIEAMAAGLPVVVSDWDGYKDTVRDGVDGFRVATLMPQSGLGVDLASRHALEIDSYDMYCGHTCSMVAVDVPAAALALGRLLASPALCRRMGDAGRQRAREVFDWSVIMPRYEALWARLAEIRRQQGPALKPLAQPWPSHGDPWAMFASYPTRVLTPQSRLVLRWPDAPARLARWRTLAMVNFTDKVLPSNEELQHVLTGLAAGSRSARQLVQGLPAARQALCLRALVWLVKLDVLGVVDEG